MDLASLTADIGGDLGSTTYGIEIAMDNNILDRRAVLRRLLALGGATAAAALIPLEPAEAKLDAPDTGKWIEVVLSKQRINAWQNGSIVLSSLVSTGRPATPTVRGRFKVWTKLVSTRMRGPGYDLKNVPYTMYFHGGYGIHGAYWHNNWGRTMSHGCVNEPIPFARQLFNWSYVGIPVIVRV